MSLYLIKRLNRLDDLIQKKATGTPAELSQKLNLSERSVYKYIGLLKELDAPIKYCSSRNSYYYEEAGCFYFHFVKKSKLIE